MKQLLSLLCLVWSLAAPAADYRIPVLADMHFDRAEYHDMDWLNADMPKDLSQIKNYIEVTRTHTPDLLASVGAAAAAGNSPMVIQLGDFTEGLCGSKELQSRMFAGAFAETDKEIKVPFLIAVGNHDVTGPGAREAFEETVLPHLAAALGREIKRADYTVNVGNDSFIFWDAMRADWEFLTAALAQAPAGRIFLLTHYPVVPYEYRADWIVYGKSGQEERRQQLRELLARYHVTVLCGHLHTASVLKYQSDQGYFYQIALNSVVRSPSPQLTNELAVYSEVIAENKRGKPESQDYRKALFAADRPFVSQFWRADFEGYGILHVRADGLVFSFYNGAGREPCKEFTLP